MSREADNVVQWIESGEPERWVATRRGQWDHHDWITLLETLRRSAFWPMREADIGGVLEAAREDMIRQAETDPDRPISAVMSAMMFAAANGDDATVRRLRRFVLDAHDGLAERWQLMRFAERDAWRAVELLLFCKGIERRFREGELDAWEQVTPFGEDIRSGLEEFYGHRSSLKFPAEPKSFTMSAFQELRAARLCGLLYAESAAPDEAMANLADDVGDRFPNLAVVVGHPGLDIPGMALEFLHFRSGVDEQLNRQFAEAGFKPIPPRTGATHLAPAFHNWPDVIEEFIGDLVAEAMLKDRERRKEARGRINKPLTPEEDADLEREARAEVQKLLGRAEVIHAASLADAVAQAELLKGTHDIMVAINSLWAWYCKLPPDQQRAIGEFNGRRPQNELWTSARARLRRGNA